MKYISILGSTGSIGRQTLEVISCNKDKFTVVALVANSNIKLLEESSQDGGKMGAEKGAGMKYKASDFDLDFTKPKNYKFFQEHVSELSLEEMEKLGKRIHTCLQAEEKYSNEWLTKSRAEMVQEYNHQLDMMKNDK